MHFPLGHNQPRCRSGPDARARTKASLDPRVAAHLLLANRGSLRSGALRLKPVAVAPEVKRAELCLRLADQVALAHEHLVGVPPENSSLPGTIAVVRRVATSRGACRIAC
jgi:hypothetical protein